MRVIYLGLLAGLLILAGCIGGNSGSDQTSEVTDNPVQTDTGGPSPQSDNDMPQPDAGTVGSLLESGGTVVCTIESKVNQSTVKYKIYANNDDYAMEIVEYPEDQLAPGMSVPMKVFIAKKKGEKYEVYLRVNKNVTEQYCDWIKLESYDNTVSKIDEGLVLGKKEQMQFTTPDGTVTSSSIICEAYTGADPFQADGEVCEFNFNQTIG